MESLGFEEPSPIQAMTLARTLPLLDPTVSAASSSPSSSNPDSAFFIHAPTGSGKTLAFALPLLSRLSPTRRSVQAIVLCPTRELVVQHSWELRKLASDSDSLSKIVVMPCAHSTSRSSGWLRSSPPHIIVATPSSLQALLKGERSVAKSLRGVGTVVIDEADAVVREHDKEVRYVLGNALSRTFREVSARGAAGGGPDEGEEFQGEWARSRLTLFASATIASRSYFLKSAVQNGWVGAATTVEHIRSTDNSPTPHLELTIPPNLSHFYLLAPAATKRTKLARNSLKRDYLNREDFRKGAAIVFAREGADVEEIGRRIAKDFAGVLYSDGKHGADNSWMPNTRVVVSVLKSALGDSDGLRERQAAVEVWKGEIARMDRRRKYGDDAYGEGDDGKDGDEKDDAYRSRTLRILVATTDSFSRGIDCPDCHTVYNLDLPDTGSEYVHRGGRAGRMGRPGRVVNVVGGEKELFVVERLGREVGAVIAEKKPAGD